jgi:hypothetical protein
VGSGSEPPRIVVVVHVVSGLDSVAVSVENSVKTAVVVTVAVVTKVVVAISVVRGVYVTVLVLVFVTTSGWQ